MYNSFKIAERWQKEHFSKHTPAAFYGKCKLRSIRCLENYIFNVTQITFINGVPRLLHQSNEVLHKNQNKRGKKTFSPVMTTLMETAKKVTKETAKEATKEKAQEATRETAKEATKETVKEVTKEKAKEATRETVKEATREVL